MTEDHYPSPREALFGNGHIANLRCAVKYFVWQGSYLLLALLGTLLLTVVTAYRYLKRGAFALGGYLPTGAAGRGIVRVGAPVGRTLERGGLWLYGGLTSERAKWVARGVVTIIGVAALVAAAGFVLWAFIFHTLVALATVGAISLGLVAIALGIYIWEDTGAPEAAGATIQRAGSKAKETPGVRRVYGNCPVHMDLEPRWFERLEAMFD